MSTLLISYDLGVPESRRDYTSLIEFIKENSEFWARPLQSVWLIKTPKDASVVRDEIKRELDVNDRLLVIDVTGRYWSTWNISQEVTDWMGHNL